MTGLDQMSQQLSPLTLDELATAIDEYIEELGKSEIKSNSKINESLQGALNILNTTSNVECVYFLPATKERIYTVIIAKINGRAVAFAIFDEKGFAMNGGANVAHSTSESFRGLFLGERFDGTTVPDSIGKVANVNNSNLQVIAVIPKSSDVGKVLRTPGAISGSGMSVVSLRRDMEYMSDFRGQIALVQEHQAVNLLLNIVKVVGVNIPNVGNFDSEGNIVLNERGLSYIQNGPDALNP